MNNSSIRRIGVNLNQLGARIRERLEPSHGRRPGRPTDPLQTEQRKVSMTEDSLCRLEELAAVVSTPQRQVSPMQVAAQLLEEVVEEYTKNSAAA